MCLFLGLSASLSAQTSNLSIIWTENENIYAYWDNKIMKINDWEEVDHNYNCDLVDIELANLKSCKTR